MKRWTLINALRVAASIYDSDALNIGNATPAHERAAEQFRKQAEDAYEAAREIENSTTIHLED